MQAVSESSAGLRKSDIILIIFSRTSGGGWSIDSDEPPIFLPAISRIFSDAERLDFTTVCQLSPAFDGDAMQASIAASRNAMILLDMQPAPIR